MQRWAQLRKEAVMSGPNISRRCEGEVSSIHRTIQKKKKKKSDDPDNHDSVITQ